MLLTEEQTERLAGRVTHLLAADPQFSANLPDADVARAMVAPGIGLAGLLRTVTEGYRDRPALATRASTVVTTAGRRHRELLPRFDTITYGELGTRVTAVAAAMADHGVRTGDRVATLGFISAEYTVIDMAIAVLGAVAVPLHAGSPAEHLHPIVGETGPSLLAASSEHLGTAADLTSKGPSIRALLVFDHHTDVDDHLDALAATTAALGGGSQRIDVETLDDAIARGAALPLPAAPAPEPERLAAIIYTSGSSGSPKGAMHPERIVKGAWCTTASVLLDRGFALPAITINYLPMSHTGGRAMLYGGLGGGGTAYFAARSDLATIIDDLALVRPTQLNFVPRVWELLHREFTARVARGRPEDDVLTELREQVLGGRYLTALTGSAPISAELAEWVRRLIDWHLIDALGATESGAVIVDGRVQRPPVIDYKLVDVPELGYYGTDRPHPRGELLLKSATLFQGYYGRDDLTAEVFDDEGYYRTGDVVAELGPDQLRYVDRRNNVLKLSNGEFVTVAKLEGAYATAELIRQVYVYGNSERSYLLAVVVPTEAALAELDAAELELAILRSLRHRAAEAGLESHEVPRDVLVEPEPFTVANGLLTGIRKPSRGNLKAKYQAALESLYDEHADAEAQRWRELAAAAATAPVVSTVCRAAGAVLGTVDGDPEPHERFTDLGGDSLSALTCASALSDLFGVEVSVSDVISPANDLQRLAECITELRDRRDRVPTFASVHGGGTTEVRADDLRLDRFLPGDLLERARTLPVPSGPPRHVFLTGATGYLGRYLALAWLERLQQTGGTLTCLVRAADDGQARARLDAVFDSGDPGLLARYRSLAAQHLRVLAGDKGADRLGLAEKVWADLCESVDLIVDPAALVNHVLPYPQLFGPNVVGTAQVVRLAISERLKPVAHVSSIAVGMSVPEARFVEDADVREIAPTRPVDDSYASGYATSKWAGEVLLRHVHDLCGLPVSVFRCDMLMAEPTLVGQLNLPDMVTRLLMSVAAVGLAPASFYAPAEGGGRARAHFDGLPVDFVADAISTLATDPTPSYRTFHVVNPRDDGIGLDEYVDWAIDAGWPIERIDDHGDWYERFESALRNLPERQRHASLLPIVQTYRHQLPATVTTAPADRFAEAVAAHRLGDDGLIPGIGPANIAKYLADLELLGYLEAVPR